ncbi:hypothetical protein BDR26DRAFT_331380, partial [Obelidium mucronatum]
PFQCSILGLCICSTYWRATFVSFAIGCPVALCWSLHPCGNSPSSLSWREVIFLSVSSVSSPDLYSSWMASLIVIVLVFCFVFVLLLFSLLLISFFVVLLTICFPFPPPLLSSSLCLFIVGSARFRAFLLLPLLSLSVVAFGVFDTSTLLPNCFSSVFLPLMFSPEFLQLYHSFLQSNVFIFFTLIASKDFFLQNLDFANDCFSKGFSFFFVYHFFVQRFQLCWLVSFLPCFSFLPRFCLNFCPLVVQAVLFFLHPDLHLFFQLSFHSFHFCFHLCLHFRFYHRHFRLDGLFQLLLPIFLCLHGSSKGACSRCGGTL